MKTRRSLLNILLLMAVILTGCTKNEFKIEFSFPESVWDNLGIQYYASDKSRGFWIESTVPLDHGKGSVKGITRNPTLIQIASSSGRNILAYAERGDEISISGPSADMSTWEVSGNKTNEEMTRLRKALPLNSRDSLPAALARMVRENADSPAAMILLASLYPRQESPKEFAGLWNSLDPSLRDSELARLIGAADLGPTSGLESDGNGNLRVRGERVRIASIPLRTVRQGGDTLRTRGTRAGILYFWNSGNDIHREVIDTLRSLSRSFPDSASRNIADLCLNQDSISWVFPLESDSLRRTVRGWLPLGLADSYTYRLGIPRTLFLIVTDAQGYQKYRGADIKKASRTFRSLMRQRPANRK